MERRPTMFGCIFQRCLRVRFPLRPQSIGEKGIAQGGRKQLRRLRCVLFHSSTYYYYCLSPEQSGLIRAFSLTVKPRPVLHKSGSRDGVVRLPQRPLSYTFSIKIAQDFHSRDITAVRQGCPFHFKRLFRIWHTCPAVTVRQVFSLETLTIKNIRL